MKKLSPPDFVTRFLPFALKTQEKTGISAVAILAQAALESGWGERAVGNMFFGVKDADGRNGNEQLLVTTEYFDSPNKGHLFPEVLSVTWDERRKKWKYKVKDWFRKFRTPEASFTHHAKLLTSNPRYAEALKVKTDPTAFVKAIAKAGYATSPEYAEVMVQMVKSIEKRLPNAPQPREMVSPTFEVLTVEITVEISRDLLREMLGYRKN